MALLDVVFRLLNKAGDAFVEPRREDGHGSKVDLPTHVQVANLPSVQQISGTVALDSASLVALENVTVNVEAGASVGVNNFPATQVVADGGGSLTVDGTVSVGNFPATQQVSGSVNAAVTGSVSVLNQLVPQAFNAIDLTYNGDGTVATAVYKSGATTVATLTLSYTSGRLTSVVRS